MKRALLIAMLIATAATLTAKIQIQPAAVAAVTATRAQEPSQSEPAGATAAHGVSRRALLESAYRAFANGDLGASEQALTSILNASPSGEAFLLRGCTRYTRAMLSRSPEAGLTAARSDFKAALKLNRALRLDKTAFSPKLIAYFEQVRRGG